MVLTLGSIIESVARDVDRAYRTLKKEGIRLSIPEVDVTLSFEVELDGVPEDASGKTPPVPKATSKLSGRLILDKKTFAQRGISFNRIAMPGPSEDASGTSRRNLEIRCSFVPHEDDE